VRNLREKLPAQFVNHLSPVLPLELAHYLLQNAVPLEDAGFGQFSKRHFVGIVTDLLHLLRHHLHVEDKPNELLDWLSEGGYRCLLFLFFCLGFLFLLGRGVFLVVHLDFLVSLLLFVQFLVILLNRQFPILKIGLATLALHAHSPPPREKHEL
jgi:hypothetical protein